MGTGHAREALDGCLQPEGFRFPCPPHDRPTKLELETFARALGALTSDMHGSYPKIASQAGPDHRH